MRTMIGNALPVWPRTWVHPGGGSRVGGALPAACALRGRHLPGGHAILGGKGQGLLFVLSFGLRRGPLFAPSSSLGGPLPGTDEVSALSGLHCQAAAFPGHRGVPGGD